MKGVWVKYYPAIQEIFSHYDQCYAAVGKVLRM